MATKTCPYCAEEIKAEAIRCRFCHSWLSHPPEWARGSMAEPWSFPGPGKGWGGPIRRPVSGRMFAGVCAAIARYFGVDATLVRVAYVVATLFTLGVPGVVLYVVLALVIPSEDDGGFL